MEAIIQGDFSVDTFMFIGAYSKFGGLNLKDILQEPPWHHSSS